MIQVLYVHSETPIKLWSSEMLHKLEADMFGKDDGGDACVGEEKENDSKSLISEFELIMNLYYSIKQSVVTIK